MASIVGTPGGTRGHDKIGAMAYAKLDETVNMRFKATRVSCGEAKE
jgi:hypothetical protein